MTLALTLQAEAPPLTDDGGGGFRVAGTRVSLDTIIAEYHQRQTPEQIAESYPAVPLAQVYAVIAYYLRHQAEVDAYLRRREHEAAELRRKIEAMPENQALRKRILERARERGLRP
jgi:uncharacterized protein (DUF433 family)